MYQKKINLLLETLLLPINSYKYAEDPFYARYIANGEDIELRRLLNYIGKKAIIYSLDELNLILRKNFNFNKNKGVDSLKSYIDIYGDIASKLLSHRDGNVCFKYWDDKSEFDFDKIIPYKGYNKILIWNNLNLKTNVDFLWFCYLVKNNLAEEKNLNNFYNNITLEDKQLEGVLSKGISETHLHLSASNDFIVVWEKLMSFKHMYTGGIDILNSMNDLFDTQIEDVVETINNFVLIRLLMAVFMRETDENIPFNKFLFDIICKSDIDPDLSSSCNEKSYYQSNFSNMFEFIRSFLEEDKFDKNYSIQKAYEEIYVYFDKDSDTLYRDSNSNDYSNERFYRLISTHKTKSYGENIFMLSSLRYTYEVEEDILFEKTLHKYLTLRNTLYRCMIEDIAIKGLDYFKKVFDYSTMRLGEKDYKELLRRQLTDKYLDKVEVRLSFKDNPNQIRKDMQNFLGSYIELKDESNSKVAKVGVILHFIKKKDNSDDHCLKKYLENTIQNKKQFYYGHIRKEYMKQINALLEAIKNYDELSKFIVGIDAASGENDAEPWVFAPIYRKARGESSSFLTISDSPIKSLGFTFHVGEDFRHLLTGLRRIDEVISHFGYRAGDRIGHAIALGVNPSKYKESNPIVYMPQIELLENYLWVWNQSRMGDNDYNCDTNYIEQNIIGLAESIYGFNDDREIEGITVYKLYKAYESKFLDNTGEIFSDKYKVGKCSIPRSKCEYKNGSENDIWTEKSLFYAYHCETYIKRMNKIINVQITDSDIKIMNYVKKVVLKKLSVNGIIVETNPSSNVVIGEVKSIMSHHIAELDNAYDKGAYDPYKSLITTINSDDPSVFHTNLSSEFAYIFYSLMDRGYPKKHILSWIDKIREYGMTSSFIKSRDYESYQKELDKLMYELSKNKK